MRNYCRISVELIRYSEWGYKNMLWSYPVYIGGFQFKLYTIADGKKLELGSKIYSAVMRTHEFCNIKGMYTTKVILKCMQNITKGIVS